MPNSVRFNRQRQILYFIRVDFYNPIAYYHKEERNISGDLLTYYVTRVGGVTVSMVAFQAADPGSTPG